MQALRKPGASGTAPAPHAGIPEAHKRRRPLGRRAHAGLLQAVLAALMGAWPGCSGAPPKMPGSSPEPPIHVQAGEEAVRAAIAAALRMDGFDEVVFEEGDAPGQLGRVVAHRTRSATNMMGYDAFIDYFAQGDGIRVEMQMPHPMGAIVRVGKEREALHQKLSDHLALAERRATAEREPAPHVATSSPARAPVVAEPTPPPREPGLPPFTGQRHVLIVGISEYGDGNFSNLPRAEADARALQEFLTSPAGGNLAASRVHVLVGAEATREKVLGSLYDMCTRSMAGDMIILYFAGHGRAPSKAAGRYLMPADGRFAEPVATGIDRDEVRKLLDRAVARRQLVLLDCCFAGDDRLRGGDFIEKNPFQELWSSGKDCQRAVVTSTSGLESALDGIGDAPNSPFATSLLEALRGESAVDKDNDDRLSVDEVYNHVYHRVVEQAKTRGHEMHPQVYGSKELVVAELPRRP